MPFEIVVAPLAPPKMSSTPPSLPRDETHVPHARRPAHDVLDLFIDGANVTARVRETHGCFVLRDLALALSELSQRVRAKTTVRFYDEPWEICIDRFGPTALLSVYRTGPDPLIAIYDRAVPFDDVVEAARDAVDALLSDGDPAPAARLALTAAAEPLSRIHVAEQREPLALPAPVPVVVEIDRDSPVSFGAEFAVRPGAAAWRPDGQRAAWGDPRVTEDSSSETVERSDTHAILFRGRVRADVRGRVIDLGECHPMLVAERLVEMGRRAFDAWERGLPFHARSEAHGVLLGLRLSAAGELALTLGPTTGSRRAVRTFPALGVADVLEAALAFGRALVRAVLRSDRSQSSNLKLSALRRMLRDSTDALRAASRTDAKVNDSPERYRAYAVALAEERALPAPPWPTGRLRYAPRWRAIVPGIDLRATYLCGDRLVVGAATEMWALDRQTGRVLWRTDVARGTSVVTPVGIVRLSPDGSFFVYDVGSGERTLRTRVEPRAGAPVAGAVVHLPGLPRLAIVTEGDHHLVAIDLTTGEPRWRWSWGATRGSGVTTPRMKRAGRLVYFTCGDGALTALDVTTGTVVWRVRDRLRFRTAPTVARDALFALSGGAHGIACLSCIDPYSGQVRWQTRVAAASAPCTVEGVPLVAASAVAVAVRQKTGLALVAFRPEDGMPLFDRRELSADPIAPLGTSWLAVDDAFLGNAPTGELFAIDARSGGLRWRHVLGPRPLEADIPRRLEPVLRSGALFVPCSLVSRDPAPFGRSAPEEAAAGVCIVRPSDGTMLGSLAPTETIPDLLRVDERCDVYIAEESGHLAAFGSLPRLSLVPNRPAGP